MSTSSTSKQNIPEYYPKPEVPEGMERCFPFFLDSQTPPYTPFNTALRAASTTEATGSDFEDDINVFGEFHIITKSMVADTNMKAADMNSSKPDRSSNSADRNDSRSDIADENDCLLETN